MIGSRISTTVSQCSEGNDNQRAVRIRLVIRESTGIDRYQEPVSVGIPLARGLADEGAKWQVWQGIELVPCEVQTVEHWSDGTSKWLSVMFLADVHASDSTEYELRMFPGGSVGNGKTTRSDGNGVVTLNKRVPGRLSAGSEFVSCVGTEAVCEILSESVAFTLPRRDTRLISRACFNSRDILGQNGIRLECVDARGRVRPLLIESVSTERSGPLRCEVRFSGRVVRCRGLEVAGSLTVFAAKGLVRLEATLKNPTRAKHAGGCWDLGDPGSILLRGWRMTVHLADARPSTLRWLTSPSAPMHEATDEPLRICQYSSGGQHWNSRNHINRHRETALRIRGYRTQVGSIEHEGFRASPTLSIDGPSGAVSCALTEFWERFPSAIGYDAGQLIVEFWPVDSGDLHELQAGEHCTRVVWLRFAEPGEAACERLAWVHDPLLINIDPAWAAASDAVPWLPSHLEPPRQEFQTLMQEALTGPRGFFNKREVIDEFGWRNYGDVWADHESAYYDGPAPIISHYNNQYDLLYGFLIQYLITGDRRWWQLADPLARHVMDIDVYHTTRDKSAYSGGLFWHTAHYRDADTSSHRAYSRSMRGPSGGPANEHAYSSGLLLYYYLTGDRRAKDTVIQLGEWIIAMDSGPQHLLGLLSETPTGRASCTAGTVYHGPGRGAGNAIGVLLDAWLAAGDGRFVDFAESLIQRTIHPTDDIASLGLNDFEQRWSYTVYLQVLARYLHVARNYDRPREVQRYVQRCLLNYAHWMAANDLFALDHPEQLEFPTETWAAHELRKGNVLYAAAQIWTTTQGEYFRRRACEIMDRAWATLMAFESRCCTRPLAVVLQQAYIEQFFLSFEGVPGADEMSKPEFWPSRAEFVSQRDRIRADLHSPLAAARMGLRALHLRRWVNVWRRSWTAERLRRWIASLR
jgi:hypothetical protein